MRECGAFFGDASHQKKQIFHLHCLLFLDPSHLLRYTKRIYPFDGLKAVEYNSSVYGSYYVGQVEV